MSLLDYFMDKTGADNKFHIYIDNQEYTLFTNLSITKSVENLVHEYSLECTLDLNENDILNKYKTAYNIKRGSSIVFKFQDEPILTGYIDIIQITTESDKSTIKFGSYSKLNDLIDTKCDKSLFFKKGANLKDSINLILSNANIASVKVITSETMQPFPNDLIKSNIGESLWDIIDRLCKINHVLATENGEGNLTLITLPSEKQISYLRNTLENPSENNILSSSVTYNDSNRFYLYKTISEIKKEEATTDSLLTVPVPALPIAGAYIDNEIRVSKKQIIQADTGLNLSQTKARAEWEGAIQKARSFNYSLRVSGFTDFNNNIYKIGQKVNVIDVYADINSSNLIIINIKYTQNENEFYTDLTLGYNEAFNYASTSNKTQNALLKMYSKGGNQYK